MRGPALLLATAALLGAGGACGENQTFVEDGPDEPAAFTCLPNLDGRIEASELRPTLNQPAAYYHSGAHAVTLGGSVDTKGHRVWDFAWAPEEETALEASAHALGASWYAASFPGGQFATAIDAGGTVEGVYRHDATGLWLLGLASTEEAPAEGKTLLVYQAPVAVFRFPLEPGAQWSDVGVVTGGTLRGLPYGGSDAYDSRVDGSGQVVLPDLSFTQAHRVRTTVTVTPAIGNVTTTRRQVSFVFECFGEVVRVTSQDGENAEDFTQATEVRRLSL